MSSPPIADWTPDDPVFWRTRGRPVAQRNLALSIVSLTLAFAVWTMWSVVVVHMPAAGFRYSTNQLFWLAALPALSGATLRFVYAFAVPVIGGRRWTALSTASLLLPALATGLALRHPDTPFETMVGVALLCGLGGGHFAGSMAHIGFFYPKTRVGTALGLNAGLGNLGVPLAQLVVPLAIGAGAVALPNAGFVWLPFIAAVALAAWWGMDDVAGARGSFGEQAVIVRRQHTWLMCWLYTGTFGSFIGLAAGLPLLAEHQFGPGDAMASLVWLGPLAGALTRPLGGWLADHRGGARVTLWAFVALVVGVAALWLSLPGRRPLFVAACALLFAAAGVGNGSAYRMIPLVFGAPKEAGAALGFASAVGAYGGFVIPKALGTSLSLTGSAGPALLVFAAFYLSCIAITWWHYGRRFAPTPC